MCTVCDIWMYACVWISVNRYLIALNRNCNCCRISLAYLERVKGKRKNLTELRKCSCCTCEFLSSRTNQQSLISCLPLVSEITSKQSACYKLWARNNNDKRVWRVRCLMFLMFLTVAHSLYRLYRYESMNVRMQCTKKKRENKIVKINKQQTILIFFYFLLKANKTSK